VAGIWHRLRGLLPARPATRVPAALWSRSFAALPELEAFWQAEAGTLGARRAAEAALESALGSRQSATLDAFCWPCGGMRPLLYDRLYAGEGTVNWRERLVCPACQLNNRLRLSLHALAALPTPPDAASRLYATEQLTPLARALRQRFPAATLSEFLGPERTPGSVDDRGIRHEDVTRLSFADASLDYILSFDVLEHVPSYGNALAEFARTLRPGGTLLLSVPFALGHADTIIRARIAADGKVEHLLPAEYHGDPVDPEKGVLCYYHFGWSLLDEMQREGFAAADLRLYYSADYGYIGGEQMLIVATR
jgi:SAM-dependent methyltransferase